MRGVIMKKGLFITFEGNDGSGKTTIANLVVGTLQELGYDVVYTREPGGIRIAEDIRSIILNPEYTEMDPMCEAMLYAAARRQHLVQKVLPALAEHKIVICDRFIDSSLAYQGSARGLGISEIYELNQFAVKGHMPDLTLFLKVDLETGLSRVQARGAMDRMDQESMDFHIKVAQGYDEVLKSYQERIHVIDASQEVEQVFQDTMKVINELVKAYEG